MISDEINPASDSSHPCMGSQYPHSLLPKDANGATHMLSHVPRGPRFLVLTISYLPFRGYQEAPLPGTSLTEFGIGRHRGGTFDHLDSALDTLRISGFSPPIDLSWAIPKTGGRRRNPGLIPYGFPTA